MADLPKLPRRGLVVLTCMDHRIDPAAALGLELGDAMVLRNAGGRVTPAVLDELGVLEQVAAKRGGSLADLELVLMQHSDCGAALVAPDVPADPAERVRLDIEALEGDRRVPDSLAVTGLVYETATGDVAEVEKRSRLRGQA